MTRKNLSILTIKYKTGIMMPIQINTFRVINNKMKDSIRFNTKHHPKKLVKISSKLDRLILKKLTPKNQMTLRMMMVKTINKKMMAKKE